jgi:hypothetical protein
MHHNRFHHKGFGGFRRRFPNAEELLRLLEEHQRDLEEEAADVAELIKRLQQAQTTPAGV